MKSPTRAVTGSLIEATCETDSANPPAHIQWSIDTAVVKNSDQYRIESTAQVGNYNAKRSLSLISFNVSKQINGSVFIIECGIVGQSLVSRATVIVLGKMHIC